jgi:site-specific DNA recombinase
VAFHSVKASKFKRNKSDWIEIPNVSPQIVSVEVFEAAKRQLATNKIQPPRDTKAQYLLKSRVRCKQCGHAYSGRMSAGKYRRYMCIGRMKALTIDRCHNRGWKADELESKVWDKLEQIIKEPDLFIDGIKKQRDNAGNLDSLRADLQKINRQFKTLDHSQEQLLKQSLMGFPESLVIAE